MAKIILDPVTRLEGHMKVEVTLDTSNVVTIAKVTGNMFRGYENVLEGRPPKDAAFITQRVCGVCPVPHAVASSKASEAAAGFTPSMQALMLRNLILGANYIASHLLHFYHLVALDYVSGPQMSPWTPGFTQDIRLNSAENAAVVGNYVAALSMLRKANEMAAIFGGKFPHVASITPGGVTAIPSADDIARYKTLLDEVTTFVTTTYHNDVEFIAKKYSDYLNVGIGYGNFVSYGVFDLDQNGKKLFKEGVYTNNTQTIFDHMKIKESVKHSWYVDAPPQHPSVGSTMPSYGKTGAYTWLKSESYNNLPHEAGPLARMWISGDYRRGTSVIDRHAARQVEAEKLVKNMKLWINEIGVGVSGYQEISITSGSGAGLTEAPRGALGHWMTVTNSAISKYQLISPTCWNGSPRDDSGNFGPIEKALVGTTVANPAQAVELLRIVHAFDPCTSCAVHVMSPDGEDLSNFVVNSTVCI